MKNVIFTVALTLFTFLGLFAQDTVYVSATDTFTTVPNGYTLTGVTTTVTDTVISQKDTLMTGFQPVSYNVNFGYETYTLFYRVENANNFNGDFTLKVNGNVDTVINFQTTPTNPNWKTSLMENDVVNMTITDNGSAAAFVWSDVVNTTVYVEVEMTTSVNDFDGVTTFSIYPNPTTNFLRSNLENNTHVLFQVFNMNGQVLKQGQVVNNTLDVTDLPKGMYVVELNIDGTVVHNKFNKH